MKTERYKGYTIHIRKRKDGYDWCIEDKHPLEKRKKVIVRDGLALVENKKMVLNIAKEVIDKI